MRPVRIHVIPPTTGGYVNTKSPRRSKRMRREQGARVGRQQEICAHVCQPVVMANNVNSILPARRAKRISETTQKLARTVSKSPTDFPAVSLTGYGCTGYYTCFSASALARVAAFGILILSQVDGPTSRARGRVTCPSPPPVRDKKTNTSQFGDPRLGERKKRSTPA